MKPSMPRGFTILELLVVIVIIAMLVGLVVPWLNQMHNGGGHPPSCVRNQSQVALALLNYEAKQGCFPGWRQTLPNGREVSWMTMILPYLEYNQLYATLTAEETNEDKIKEALAQMLPVMKCPQSDKNNLDRTRISYVANCGKMDAVFSAVGPDNPGGHEFDDDRENGVFFDHVKTETKMSVEQVSENRGTGYTILLSENLQAGKWNETPRENLLGFCWPDPSFLNQKRDICNGKDASVVPVLINRCLQGDAGIEHGRINGLGEYRFARPASNHPGLVVAAFCDRSVRPINENIDPEIFQKLMRVDKEIIKPEDIQ